MNLPLFIARRYLFAKKSHNVINIISAISVLAMATGVMALVVVLSVFNGFDSLIRSMFSRVDPDLRIELVEGKTFADTTGRLMAVRNHPSVAVFTEVLQENALFRYRDRQHIGVLKGVAGSYPQQNDIDSAIIDGTFQLWRGSQPLAVMGQGVAFYLNASLGHYHPLVVYMPRRGRQVVLTTAGAFRSRTIMPSGVLAVEQEFDAQYVIVPIEVARELLGQPHEVTSVQLRLAPRVNPEAAQAQIQALLGEEFSVLNRFQQNETLYRTMRSEKLAIGLILSLILVIASFNIIGSLSMLIMDKRKDVETLRSLGADNRLIRKIFMAEGILISVVGSLIGIVVGVLICWAQIQFELVKLRGTGAFIIDAYPVEIQPLDILYVLTLVIALGYLAARFPVQLITNRILNHGRPSPP